MLIYRLLIILIIMTNKVVLTPVMMVIEMMTSIGETEVPPHEYKKAPVGVGTEKSTQCK